MELTQRQRNILKDMQTRKPTLTERARMGDKSARQVMTALGFDCDVDDGDFDGPKEY